MNSIACGHLALRMATRRRRKQVWYVHAEESGMRETPVARIGGGVRDGLALLERGVPTRARMLLVEHLLVGRKP